MNNIDFEDLIIKTITEDLIKNYKMGNDIALRIQKEWKLYKQENIHSGDEYLSDSFIRSIVHPIFFKLDPPPSDMAYKKTMNASLLRLKNEYSKYFELISSLYRITFRNRENQKYPLKWMKTDKQITKNMNKKKNKYFYTLFNFIIQSRTSLKPSKYYAFRNKIGKYKEAYDYILYRPKPKYSDLRKHSDLDSLSNSKIYLYLWECVRHGIFIDKFNGRIRKDPKTRTKIYAIGYYSSFDGGFRRNYFLTKKRHQQILRDFDAEFYKKYRADKK